MTTELRKKSVYDSNETPNREDKKKAQELYYQDGAPSAILMAEELAMQRRYSVKSTREQNKMNDKLDNLTVMTATSDASLTEQGKKQGMMMNRQQGIDAKLNKILGIGIAASIFIPVFIVVIMLIK